MDNIKKIKDVNILLKIRNEIRDKIIEIKANDDSIDDDAINLLKKQYSSISNKINYINNKDSILEKYKEKNREYVRDNYEVIKEKNKQYQTKYRQKFKELQQFYNNNKETL